MKRILNYFFLLVLFFTLNTVKAQDKLLTLKDAVWMNPDTYPSSLKNLKWKGASDDFTYIAKNKLVKGNVNSEKRDTILSVDELNPLLSEFGIKESKGFPSIKWINKNEFIFKKQACLFSFDINKKKLKLLNRYDDKANNVEIEENNFKIAYTKENNLYVSIDGYEVPVTNDKNKGIVNGQAVHRNEFGINGGIFWSPKGNLLAYYRMDETMVTDYPIVDITTRIATVENIKYPMAGMTSHQVTLGVYNPVTNKTVFMKTGQPAEQYLCSITWDPNEKYIYIAILNRDQNHLKLNKYNAATGDFVKTLFEEKNKKYVEPENSLYFLKSSPDKFIWLSRRDGFKHMYLYNTDGKLLKQITKGKWLVNSIVGIHGNYVFFTSTKISPLNKDLFSVNIKNLKINKISHNDGTHTAYLNENGKYLFDIYSSIDITKEYLLLNSKGEKLQTLLPDKNPLKDYKLGEMSVFTIKNNEGTDLYCRMIKPIDFDATKKYPVFLYVYGGPHAQLITNSWLGGAGLFLNYMAEKGYVVFTLDNRGSANRGFDFESAIYRNCGTVEVEDQMKGVEYLKTLPFVDTTRIGVDGWSYGGFMTISLTLKNPGVFKVACAGGPVIDWKYYEVMYGERYMDKPQDNPIGYKNACLLNYVDNLKGKLLILHGTSDPTVMWQNSLRFIKTCIEHNVQVDYFVYPGHGHNVRGKDRIHMYQKIENYFKDYL
ncbi:MAG: DPP IV N-terminal domain-containing protein [Bacteroidales bacterium]|nr:DPP IV N-terminal domain-containing protein [Bacteroidales bacterium]